MSASSPPWWGKPWGPCLSSSSPGCQNLASILEAHVPGARLEFWSIQGRYEVDFVVTHGRTSIGIEVKASGRFNERDLAGLKAFLDATSGARAGVLAYNGTEALSVGKDLYAIPLTMLLS